MYLHISNLLSCEQVAAARHKLAQADWVHGRETAGHLSVRVKENSQLPENHVLAAELGTLILDQLEINSQFMSAALPLRIVPPLFNRYRPDDAYGRHIDGAVRSVAGASSRLRTDLSATLFLSDPDTYEGGELEIEEPSGAHAQFKLPAGDLLLYPGSTVHRVIPVRAGVRLASFFWIQSMIRESSRREMLYSLDSAIRRLTADHPDHSSIVDLTAHYHNLVRAWADV